MCVQSWHTLRSRQGLLARGANVRQGRPPTSSGYQALAGSYYPAGAHASSREHVRHITFGIVWHIAFTLMSTEHGEEF